jgi:glycosyltransferase involved in cell wall biosynthesis
MNNTAQIAVVLPSFRVKAHILDVIGRIGPECQHIYVVDDACPEGSGAYVQAHCSDPRVQVLTHDINQGVGGAVMTGYRQAVTDGCDVVVKIDGDGQMAPELLPQFVAPILDGYADYTKGNRFYDLTQIRQMPGVRLFGNAVLSFMSKFSSGYWDIFDPTNGYTAIHTRVVEHLPLDKISSRYFFESDMLFRLNTLRCVVVDIPMDAVYGDEKSGLKIKSILLDFLWKHARNYSKRIFYNYFLRDLSAASMQLVLCLVMLVFGVSFGLNAWHNSSDQGIETPAGTVMVAALPVFVGLQLLLSFLTQDIQSTPRVPMHKRLSKKRFK